ncbi:transcriptional activator TenA [Proteiniborus sp. DW1]|uniref:TenA family protein n=1 Tax=Proteiniborus sp. DW1 TaxID=1889883 RepID=UPI00092DF038|nr:TenA family protein [Proteiniborus sp. DW1]SCG83030.1 transcriptional activator TenA [Proteiniborus sp. DW1]
MSFMEETLKSVLPIWDSCIETPFVQEVKNGILPMEKFKNYMIQDSIYLKHYARIYGKAMYHSTTLKDIQLFYSALCFVTDTESAIRLSYLKRFGLTDSDIEGIEPLPENQNYIDFMMDMAEEGNICKILMAVLPCMLSYSYIFRKIAAEPETKKSRYWDFIEDYADERFVESCKLWSDFAEEKCAILPNHKKKELIGIFEKASLLELDFWKMAYN